MTETAKPTKQSQTRNYRNIQKANQKLKMERVKTSWRIKKANAESNRRQFQGTTEKRSRSTINSSPEETY